MKLEDAIRNIYNILFTPDKGIGVFSSTTAQSLAETVHYLHEAEELAQDNENNGEEFDYKLEYSIVPVGDEYVKYCNNVFNSNLDFNTKLFNIFLFPYYLESLVNASFAILSTDGTKDMSDYVHMALEIGNNQFANQFCLRNKIETLAMQNEFLSSKIEEAVDNYYSDIERLENINFTVLSSEFLGWSDFFPSRLTSYLLSLNIADINDQFKSNCIKNDLIHLVSSASIFTVELKRV